jgi:hypothetical protein
LETEDSRRVGWKGDDGNGSGESVGHHSGRRIVEIKRKRKADLTDADYAHMRKVIGYVARVTRRRVRATTSSTPTGVIPL